MREERDVQVDGAVEHWRIQWRRPPEPSFACGCPDFVHALIGEGDLIRSRPGKPDEVLSLEAIRGHGGGRTRKDDSDERRARIATWPCEHGDEQAEYWASVRNEIQRRPPLPVMELKDYDGDGRATEFILLSETENGCVFEPYVAIGISRRMPHLHVIGSAARPDVPVVLSRKGWATLEGGGGEYVASACGNHGSLEETVETLWADRHGIHGKYRTYDCSVEPFRLMKSASW